MQLAGLLAVQQFQEMPADGVHAAFGLDAHAFVGEAVPVGDDGREQREHAINLVVLLAEVLLGLKVTQHGAAGAHDIHRVGVFRDLLKDGLQRGRQATQALQFLLVGVQFLAIGQFAPQQKIGNFLELGLLGQIGNFIAPIGQARTAFANGTQRCFSSNLSAQARATQFFCFSHCFPLIRSQPLSGQAPLSIS